MRTKDSKHLRFFVCNLRGFNSKKLVFEKIIHDINSDLIVITETHCVDVQIPKIPNFRTFHRNRSVRAKGGIAVMVRDSIARDCAQVWCGEGEQEVLAIEFSRLEPKLVVIASYGVQANSFGTGVQEANMLEIMGRMADWKEEGFNIVWAGDMNLVIGNDLVPGNDMIISPVGRLFNKQIERYEFQIANNLVDDPTTFVDLKSGKKRSLDLVVTNCLEKIKNFQIDHSKSFTPFTIKKVKGELVKTYTDHKAIVFDLNLSIDLTKLRSVDKTLAWMYNSIENDIKYEIVTDDSIEWLLYIIENEKDIDKVVEKINKFLIKTKFRCYKIKSFCSSKFDDFMMEDVWRHRVQELTRIQEELAKEKEPNQIFKSKKLIDARNSNNPVTSIKNMETGEVLTDVDDIFQYLLDYNQDNMKKGDAISEEVDMIQKMRDEWLMEMFEGCDECPQTIPWSNFVKVVKKTHAQNKPVFRDFLMAGPYFKMAIFALLNRIYMEEDIPEVMRMTKLTKIYKRKGSLGDLKNFRFVHCKGWLGKLFERCVMSIIEDKINENTSEHQIGGKKLYSTRDHIATLLCLARVNEVQKTPTIISLFDLKACFDRIRMNDVFADVAETGADIKAVKVLHEFTREVKIQISGDPEPARSAVVYDTCHQGSNFAPKGTSLSVGKVTEKAIEIDDCAKLGELEVPPRDFVDDVAVANKDADSTRTNGERFSKAVELLSMECNHVKSAVIVMGGENEVVEKVRADLRADPMRVHGKEVEVKNAEPYLGFILNEKGVRASINATVKARTDRAWGRVAGIKTVINNPIIAKFGWLRAGVVLIKSIIPSILTYSCEVWADTPKYVLEGLESSYKKMIYSVLEIPEKTKFSAVLLELGMSRIEHIVKKAQILYVSQVLWEMHGTVTCAAMLEEWRINGDRSIVAHADRIANEYGLEKVSVSQLDKKVVKKVIRKTNDLELWTDCFSSRVTVSRPYIKIQDRQFFNWPRNKARALFLWRVGALKLKTQWKIYNVKRGVGTDCVMPLCGEDDTLDHIKECKWYETKWDEKCSTERELANYLVKINRERLKKVKMPIL